MAGESRAPPSPRCCSSRRSTRARWRRSSASTSGRTRTPARSTSARSSSAWRRSPRALRDAGSGAPRDGAAGRRADLRRQDHRRRPRARRRRGPARELHDRVRALSPHIGARLALDGAAAHDLAHARRGRRPAAGHAASATATRSCSAARSGALELCERAAAGRSPHARGRLAARPARRAAGGDGRVSDARTLALRVLTRVFDEGAYADRAFTGEAEQGDASTRASARSRCTSRSARCSAGARWTPRSRRSRGAPCSGWSAASRTSCGSASSRSSSPTESRRMQRFPRASSWRAARSAQRATGPRQRRAAAHRRRGPGVVRGAARGDARGGRAAPLAARLDRRAVVRRLRRASGPARCARRPTAPPALSLWPNPLRGGRGAVAAWLREAGAAAVRDDATGVLRVEGPLDVAGSDAFASGAVVPIARAAVLVAAASRSADRACACSTSARRRAARPPCWRRAAPQVTAVDAHPARAKTLEATLRRLGAEAEVVAADGRTYRGGPFDRILVDAPCSGLGVLAGRPDARWRRTPEDAEELAALQAELVPPRPRPPGARRASSTSPSARSTRRRTRRSPPPRA